MAAEEGKPIAHFLITRLYFVCPDCVPKDDGNRITFYDEEELVGYYNDLHIGFESGEHKTVPEGQRLVISCEHCSKDLAEGSVTHELSDIFDE